MGLAALWESIGNERLLHGVLHSKLQKPRIPIDLTVGTTAQLIHECGTCTAIKQAKKYKVSLVQWLK